MAAATTLSTVGTELPATPNRIAFHLARLQTLLFVLDAVVIVVAIRLGWRLRFSAGVPIGDLPALGSVGYALPAILAFWLTALLVRGAYAVKALGAGSDEFVAVSQASVLAAGLVAMSAFMIRADLSRGFFLLTFVIGTPLLIAERYAVRMAVHQLRRRGHLQHRVVAVGAPAAVREVCEVLQRQVHVGYRVVGACLPRGFEASDQGLGVPVLGTVDEVRSAVERVDADVVLVTGGGFSSAGDLRRVGWDLAGTDVDLVVAPSLMDVAGPRVHTRVVAGLPLVHVAEPQTDEAGGWSKRGFDVAVASTLLVLGAPLLGLIALAVKLADGGPVLFRQQRVGRDGDEFGMLKFRTMVADAERLRADLEGSNDLADGPLFKMREDPRVTRVGRLLRRFSLDELPQLWNVLRGQMSLVGPRPPLPDEVARYGTDVHRRLLVRPGMTGLWQVSGRSGLSWQDSVRLDLYYVDNWSIWGDLVIMLKTVREVLFSRSAF